MINRSKAGDKNRFTINPARLLEEERPFPVMPQCRAANRFIYSHVCGFTQVVYGEQQVVHEGFLSQESMR
jgi:hypothetical protein